MKKHPSHFDFAQCDTLRMTILLAAVALQSAIFNPPSAISQLPGAGNCLQYNGTSDYVNVAYNPVFTPGTQAWTVSAWVKVPVAPSTEITVVSWYRCGAMGAAGCGNPGDPTGAMYGMSIAPSGNVEWIIRDDNYNGTWLTSPSSVTDNKWHHLTGTFNPATEEKKLYIDGVLVASSSVTPITSLTTSSNGGTAVPLWIGGRYITGWGSPIEYFNGQIDEVRIWNKALTQTEIRNTMCQKLVGNEAGLVGYWRFDETNGNTAFDSSPNGNNGTLW